MAFAFEPDMSWMFNTLQFITFADVRFIWGAILALLLCFVVSTQGRHIRILYFPMLLILAAQNIYQNIVIIFIAFALFMYETFSYAMVQQAITAVAQTTKDTYNALKDTAQSAQIALSGVERKSIENIKKLKKENESFDTWKYRQQMSYKTKTPEEIQKLTPLEQNLYATAFSQSPSKKQQTLFVVDEEATQPEPHYEKVQKQHKAFKKLEKRIQ